MITNKIRTDFGKLPEGQAADMTGIPAAIKRYFISGVLVVVPGILTFMVLRFLFETLDGILRPAVERLTGRDLPVIGFVALILVIFTAGIIARSYIGNRAVSLFERWLVRLPLIRPVYGAAKQLLEALAGPKINAFKEVAAVEYPRLGIWTVVLIASRTRMLVHGVECPCAVAFIPSTPTPISGMVIIVPESQVVSLDMTIEEAVKFIVSGGVVTPELMKERARPVADASDTR